MAPFFSKAAKEADYPMCPNPARAGPWQGDIWLCGLKTRCGIHMTGPDRARSFASLQREEYHCAAFAPAVVA